MNEQTKDERDEMLDALVRIGNWCAQDIAENAYVGDPSGNYLKTLTGLCEVCRPFMEKAEKLKSHGGCGTSDDSEPDPSRDKLGDMAALRKALIDIVMLTMKVGHSIHGDVACGIIASKAKHALAKPARQCDVGTAAQQAKRYHNFTDRFNPCSYKGYARCAEDCPVHKKLAQEGHGELLCQLEWAQMPYEEGKSDGDKQQQGDERCAGVCIKSSR